MVFGDLEACLQGCLDHYNADDADCFEQYNNQEINEAELQACREAAAEAFAGCRDGCSETYSASTPSLTLVVDVDWPSVNPFSIDEGDSVDLIATDVDTSTGWESVLAAMPLDDIWNDSAWDDFRSTYFYGSLQQTRDFAKFYIAPLSEVVQMSNSELLNVTVNTPWTYLAIDTDDTDGFTASLDTTGMSGTYVTRIYMSNFTTPSSPRYGFGIISVIQPQ